MSRSKSDYEEIAVLRDPDGMGLIAPITRFRKGNGYYAFSFAIQKEFERTPGGPTERTSFMNDRHILSIRKLLDEVERRIAIEQDKLMAHRRGVSAG